MTTQDINRLEGKLVEFDLAMDMVLVVCETLEQAGDDLPNLPGRSYAEVLLAAQAKHQKAMEEIRSIMAEQEGA